MGIAGHLVRECMTEKTPACRSQVGYLYRRRLWTQGVEIVNKVDAIKDCQ